MHDAGMRIDPIYEIRPDVVLLACTECGEVATIQANSHASDLAIAAAEAEWSVHLSTYHASLALLLAADPPPSLAEA
jgi:hypothetical protein